MNLRIFIFTISTALVCLPALAQNKIYTSYDKVKLINGTPGLNAPTPSFIGRKTLNKTPAEMLPQAVRQYTTAPPSNSTQLPASRNVYQSLPSQNSVALPPARMSPYIGVPGDNMRSDLRFPSAVPNAGGQRAHSVQSSRPNSAPPSSSGMATYDQPGANTTPEYGARHF